MADISSNSNADKVGVTHIDINWTVIFDTKTVTGSVVHTATVHEDGTSAIIFDATKALAEAIDVAAVTVDGETAAVTIGEPVGSLGVPVSVALPAGKQTKDSVVKVSIPYSIGETATAVQFLTPAQTAGKTHPYLFTQAQAIHARSMLPCQDTPGAKVTYSASVTVPAPLTAVMSALADGSVEESGDSRTFKFKQPVAMPSYLIALAVGELEGREVGPRSTVWAEPSVVDAAAAEFADTEKYLSTAEDLLTPYVWGRYDVLCLPPSFPYGGMENPCLTFVTPTLLAGDRSLSDVICHEIAHSWTGNLVTTKTWEHFWLNEGCTMWVQRKVMSRLHGPAFFDFDASIGLKSLNESVALFGKDHGYTCLVPDLSGHVDPDDCFSSVPYEKGFFFLYHLAKTVGGDAFDAFFKDYIIEFSHKTVTTEQFRAFFESWFAGKADVSGIDWDTWMKAPGGLPATPDLDGSLRAACNDLADKWFADASSVTGDLSAFNTGQRVAFLDQLLILQEANPTGLSVADLDRMDEVYALTASRNSEIRFRWQKLCIRAGRTAIVPEVVAFLKEQGRMKFVRPLFRDLFKSEFGKSVAVETFKEHGSNYHPIAFKMISADLGVEAK